MNDTLPIGAEARRAIAAIFARGILTLEKRNNQREIDDKQLAIPQDDDNDRAMSESGGERHE